MQNAQENIQENIQSLESFLESSEDVQIRDIFTEEELAQNILQRNISLEEMAGTERWEDYVFFENWQEAKPGIVPFQEGEQGKNEMERQYLMEAEKLNTFLKNCYSPWRARCYHYGNYEVGIILNAKINEEVIMSQEIDDIRAYSIIERDGSKKDGVIWKARNFSISSVQTGEVLRLDRLTNSNFNLFAKNEVYEVYDPEVSINHAIADSTLTRNISNIYDVFTLFHEVGHAKDYSLHNKEEQRVLDNARRIFNMNPQEKIAYERKRRKNQLSVEDAHKITVRRERLAWAYAYRILKEINEKSGFQFGSYYDRGLLKSYSEFCLKTYDHREMVLPFLRGSSIPAFSQEGRGEARKLADSIDKGKIPKKKAFRKTFGFGVNTPVRPVQVADIYK